MIRAGRIRLDTHYFPRFVVQRLGLTISNQSISNLLTTLD